MTSSSPQNTPPTKQQVSHSAKTGKNKKLPAMLQENLLRRKVQKELQTVKK